MKLKSIILGLAILGVSSTAAMADVVGGIGVGYHASFYADVDLKTSDGEIIDNFSRVNPYGIGAYGEIGWGFGEKEIFRLLLGYAVSLDMGATNAPFTFTSSNQLRLVVALKPIPILSFSAFAGWGNSRLESIVDKSSTVNNFIVGGQVKIFSIILDYSIQLDPFTGQLKRHEVLLGVSLLD